MTDRETEGCWDEATHTVLVALAGVEETWQVCRAHDRLLKLSAVRSRGKAEPSAASPVTVRCSGCDQLLEDPGPPCPVCGSGDRALTTGTTGTAHEAVRLRTKRPGKDGWIVQVDAGDSYTWDLQAWGHRELTVDHDEDQYRETIELYDGSRIVSTARLSDHRG